VVERRRRLFVARAGVAAGAGVDATASERVAGCALLRELAVVSFAALVVFEDAVFLVRLLRVSTVTTSSVTSATAADRRVRRVDIAQVRCSESQQARVVQLRSETHNAGVTCHVAVSQLSTVVSSAGCSCLQLSGVGFCLRLGVESQKL